MTFLDCRSNLKGTIFSDKDLHTARNYLSSIILELDPPWEKKPIGILGEHWKSDTLPSVCFLINMAQTLYILANGTTQKSNARLKKKFKELLRSPKDQFEENYNEFQSSKSLIDIFNELSPLHFLQEDDFIEPKMKRCPDFALRFPDGGVFLDTTVFYGGILETWTQTAQYILSGLEKYAIEQQDNMLDISLSLPLKAEINEKEILSQILLEIQKSSTGKLLIGTNGLAEWKPISIVTSENFDRSQVLFVEGSPTTRLICPSGSTIDRAFVSQKSIKFSSKEDTEQATELLLKSLRHKIRDKRGQFPKGEPEANLLILTLKHEQLYESDINLLLQNRIWPNKGDYSWLSGLLIFTPRTHFLPSAPNDRMTLCLNPYADNPVAASLRNAFEGTR